MSNQAKAGEPRAFARCLVVVAHPDDCEFFCGGTVAKWSRAGGAATLAVLTDGSRGSHDTAVPAHKLVAQRAEEQARGAAILGMYDVRFLDHIDGELRASSRTVDAVASLIRDVQPEVIITHDPWRRYLLHPDHRATGEIVRDALYRAGEPRLALAGGAPAWKARELWLFDADEPNHVENVGTTFVCKRAALLEHRSQYRTAFKVDPDDPRSLEAFVARLAERSALTGARDGYAHGEDFRRIRL